MAARSWTTLDTPVGPVSAACSETGVTCVRFGPPLRPAGGPGDSSGPSSDAGRAGQTTAAELAAMANRQLAEYFAGRRRAFDLPLDWAAASQLQLHVLGVLFDSVGFGETVSYGALASLAAARDYGVSVPARAIGQLMGSNPIPLIVPCHRVVAADGLGGYSGGTGIEIKRWLLIFEGSVPPTLDWALTGPDHLAGLAGPGDKPARTSLPRPGQRPRGEPGRDGYRDPDRE